MTFFLIDPNAPAATADSLGSIFGAVNSISQLPPVGVGDNANANFLSVLDSIIAPVTGLEALDGIFDTTGFTSINDFALAVSAGLGSSGNIAADQALGLISGILNNGPNPGLDALAAGFTAQGGITNSVFDRGVLGGPFLS